MNKIEQRFQPVEVRVEPAKDGKPSKIVGYAAVYNSLSQDLGGFVERVMPGAFDACLRSSPDVVARYNHNAMLGRTKSGTLQLASDSKGLAYSIDLPDTTVGRDVAECIKRGDVTGSSFCFRVKAESWIDDGGDSLPIREIRELEELRDVGPVDCPAYLATENTVGLRSLSEESQAAAAAVLAARQSRRNLVAAKLKLAEKA